MRTAPRRLEAARPAPVSSRFSPAQPLAFPRAPAAQEGDSVLLIFFAIRRGDAPACFRSEASVFFRRPSTWRLHFDANDAEELARFSAVLFRVGGFCAAPSHAQDQMEDGTYSRSRKTKCTSGPMFP